MLQRSPSKSLEAFSTQVDEVLKSLPKPPSTGNQLLDAQRIASRGLVISIAKAALLHDDFVLPLYEKFQELNAHVENVKRTKADLTELTNVTNFTKIDAMAIVWLCERSDMGKGLLRIAVGRWHLADSHLCQDRGKGPSRRRPHQRRYGHHRELVRHAGRTASGGEEGPGAPPVLHDLGEWPSQEHLCEAPCSQMPPCPERAPSDATTPTLNN